jgi:hypothetical protein
MGIKNLLIKLNQYYLCKHKKKQLETKVTDDAEHTITTVTCLNCDRILIEQMDKDMSWIGHSRSLILINFKSWLGYNEIRFCMNGDLPK